MDTPSQELAEELLGVLVTLSFCSNYNVENTSAVPSHTPVVFH